MSESKQKQAMIEIKDILNSFPEGILIINSKEMQKDEPEESIKVEFMNEETKNYLQLNDEIKKKTEKLSREDKKMDENTENRIV